MTKVLEGKPVRLKAYIQERDGCMAIGYGYGRRMAIGQERLQASVPLWLLQRTDYSATTVYRSGRVCIAVCMVQNNCVAIMYKGGCMANVRVHDCLANV